MKIMPVIASLSLCAAFSAAQGSTMAFSHASASDRVTERCTKEVQEMSQVFRLRLQVVQPDLLELMSLDRPEDQLRRIRAVYSIDMRGTGQATIAQAESLLTMHYAICVKGIDGQQKL
ncbi:hypothetical protein ADT27_00780 [Xanthomonas oryzae]|uniref:hypothetical protein n=1 Tax=Xanthomonas oryzae TaxID=347 RepID=UPI0006AC19A0|nr:hypothetical protein [Xanthomonas oryzae]KOR54416.1 hypothetical protein ADT27_00780 [Xanthomonas oryzae]